MKTKEELNALKGEYETMNKKLAELTEEELEQVIGGVADELSFPFSTGGSQPYLDTKDYDLIKKDDSYALDDSLPISTVIGYNKDQKGKTGG